MPEPHFPGPIPAQRSADGLVGADTYRRPDGSFPGRDGTNPVERMAVWRLARHACAFPAGEIVRWGMWPRTLKELASADPMRGAGTYTHAINPSGKPNHPAREMIAAHQQRVADLRGWGDLDLSKRALDHLLAARTPAHGDPAPERAPGRRDLPLELPAVPPFDTEEPPLLRDGSNPFEVLAVRTLQAHVAALSASQVVQLALWPLTIEDFATDTGHGSNNVYNMLTWQNHHAYEPIRRELARHLDVSVFALAWLVESLRTPLPALPPLAPERASRRPRPRAALQTSFAFG